MWNRTANQERDDQPAVDAVVLAREDSVMLAKSRLGRAHKSNMAAQLRSLNIAENKAAMEEVQQFDSPATHDDLPQLADLTKQPGATNSSVSAEAATKDVSGDDKTAEDHPASPGKVRFSKVVEPVP